MVMDTDTLPPPEPMDTHKTEPTLVEGPMFQEVMDLTLENLSSLMVYLEQFILSWPPSISFSEEFLVATEIMPWIESS